MKISDYITDSTQISEVSEAEKLMASRGILSATRLRLDEERDTIERAPILEDGDIRKDLRYRLGFVAALKWVLDLPVESRKLIQSMESRR